MRILVLILSLLVSAFIPVTESSVIEYEASTEQEIVTIENIENEISDHLPVAPCSESAAKTSDTCSCIAAGSCKFKLSSSCKIVFCDGESLEDNTNSTVDSDKIITVTQPCPGVN